MILNTLDTKTKTFYHEINDNFNYNTISVIDYENNIHGDKKKINNSKTYITDMSIIDDDNFLLCYYHRLLKKIICKIINIDGVNVNSGQMCIIDDNTHTTVMSLISISSTRAILTYNDTLNNVGKSLLLNISNDFITIIEKYIFAYENIPELASFKLSDTEFVLFYQLKNSGIVRLIEIKNDQLELKEEQLFYKNSDLWGLSIQRIHDYFILVFIDSTQRLILKIITANKKLSFSSGRIYNQPVIDGKFELVTIDNEFAICYFNNTAQIISITDGKMIKPENL